MTRLPDPSVIPLDCCGAPLPPERVYPHPTIRDKPCCVAFYRCPACGKTRMQSWIDIPSDGEHEAIH